MLSGLVGTALAIAGLIWLASVLIVAGFLAAAVIADWIARRHDGGLEAELDRWRREGTL